MVVYVAAAILWLPAAIVSQTLPPGAQAGDRLKALGDTRGQLLGVLIPIAAGIAGTAAWFGLRATQAQLAETRRQNERMFDTTQAQLEETRRQNERTFETTQAQLKLNLQDQVNERFSRAIDQLGTDTLQVRVGALYAFEQIAHDGPWLHWPIVEIWSAFVRERSKEDRQHDETKRPVAADIQTALTLLGARDASRDQSAVDLSGAMLQGAVLAGGSFENTDFNKAGFRGASLVGAKLASADLRRVELGEARLSEADLEGADLSAASLRGAVLEGAILKAALLVQADFRNAVLSWATLEGANASGANFQSAKLSPGVELQGADLRGANLRDADLTGADLQRARLNGANLQGALLGEANLKSADLTGALLIGPTLDEATAAQDLTSEQLSEARGVGQATLPAYLQQAVPSEQQKGPRREGRQRWQPRGG